VTLDTLNDDDRVVDDQPDRQHETKQRERINGESKQREQHERSHQRDRHGQQRNQCRAHALEEDVNHKNHQGQSDHQGDHDFLYAFGYGPRGV
jgi:hypothetical protein